MCPVRDFHIKQPKQVWITNHLLEFIVEKDRLLNRARRTKKEEDKKIASDARKELNKLSRSARQNHVRQLIEDCRNDHRKFWLK